MSKADTSPYPSKFMLSATEASITIRFNQLNREAAEKEGCV
jgi:hypothetical protein